MSSGGRRLFSAGCGDQFIHWSAWKKNSRKFTYEILHSPSPNALESWPQTPPLLGRPALRVVVLDKYALRCISLPFRPGGTITMGWTNSNAEPKRIGSTPTSASVSASAARAALHRKECEEWTALSSHLGRARRRTTCRLASALGRTPRTGRAPVL